jgi:hypothetical protein
MTIEQSISKSYTRFKVYILFWQFKYLICISLKPIILLHLIYSMSQSDTHLLEPCYTLEQ